MTVNTDGLPCIQRKPNSQTSSAGPEKVRLTTSSDFMKHFNAIAAMSLNRVIGRGSEIPWHLPEDFKFFKQTTMGHVLVMGRKTFESIGRPLPGRKTIVLSRTGFSHPNVLCLNNLEELPPATPERQLFICGGAQIYRQALPLCESLYLTLVKREVDGEAIFPEFENQFELEQELRDAPEFRILLYRNRKCA
jgi:dihydrofolate reductase